MGRVGWSVVVILCIAFVVGAVEQRSSDRKETPSEGPPPTADTSSVHSGIEMMDTVDYVRTGALVVAFLATNFAGRDTWVLADFISTFSFGVGCFFFPEPLLGYQTEGKLDPGHMAMYQGFGALLLGLAATAYVSRESRDRSVLGSIMMSRILGAAVLLQSMALDHMKAKGDKQKFVDTHITFGMVGCGLWLLGHLWQYLRGPSYGSGGVDLKDRLTKHLLLDLLVILPLSLADFAFPDFILSTFKLSGFTPDGIHAHLVRAQGALTFMTCLHTHSAMGFSDDIDKRAHFLGRIVTVGMQFLMMLLYQYKYHMMSVEVFYFVVGFNLLILGNSLCAYFIRPKSKRA